MGILKAAIIGAIIGYAIARSGGRCGGRPGDDKAWFHPVAAPESLAQFGNQVQAKTQVLMDKASKAQAALVERAVKEVNGQIKNQDAQIEKMSDAVKALYGKLSRVQGELSVRLDSLEKELKAVRAASSKPPCVGVCGRLSAFWYNHTTVGERRAMKWLAAVGAAAGLAVTCHRAMQVLAERRRRDDPVTASGVLRDTMMTFCGHPLPLMPPIMTTAPAAATALPPARNNAPAPHDDDSDVDCSRVAAPAAAPTAPTRQPSSPAACAVEAAKPAVAPRGSTVLQAQQPLVAGMTYVCVFDESGVAHLVPTPAM